MFLVIVGSSAVVLLIGCALILFIRSRVVSSLDPESHQEWLDAKQVIVKHRLEQ